MRPVGPDGRIETGGTFKPIPRPRIVDRIAQAAAHPIVLIVAPAGYGKSVALSQFLRELDEPWLRCDLRPEHNTLPGVLRALSEALEPAAPELKPTLPGAYERNRASQTPGADLAIWMQQHLKAYRGTIAIDDLHVADADPEVIRFVVALIDRTKAHIRWMLSTRTVTGLPIGTWLAYNDCDLVIDDRELRFTSDEAKEAAAAFKLGVRQEELQALLDLTDGWPTALSFALRSSTRSVDLRGIDMMTREMLYNYLADQVYRSLTDEEREFLETTALLSEIDVEAMVAIGFDRTRKLISDLRERVAFIHQVSPGIYRCHDLFRDFILHQLAGEGEAAVNRLRCRIALSLEGIGRTHTPLRLYIDAGAEHAVLRLLQEHGFELINTGHVDLAQSAISSLTEEHRSNDPVVLAMRGMLEASAGRFEEAEPLLRRSFGRSTDATLRAAVATRLALLLINQGKDAAGLIDELIAQEGTISENVLVEAIALRAVVAARAKDAELANRLLDRVDDLTKYFPENESLARIKQRVGVAAWELRQDQRARFALSQAAAICSRLSLHSLGCRALDILSLEARYCENDVAYALWYAQQAVAAAGKSGDVFDVQTETLRVLAIEWWRGDIARVSDLERQAATLRTSDASRTISLVESRGFRLMWEGKFDEARRSFAAVLSQPAPIFDSVVTRSVYALALALDGDSKEAKEQVELLTAAIDSEAVKYDGFASLAFEIGRLLTALTESVAGRHVVSKRILAHDPVTSRFAALSMREAIVFLCRAAANNAPSPRDLAPKIRLMEENGLGGFARLVLLAKEHLERVATDSPARLTDAEIGILRLLAGGLSRAEIAEQTDRSVLTVQTHIKHAVAKLGCAGTQQAIEAARNRGLLKKVTEDASKDARKSS
jgi:DNA-binding NarL/FixJ family response regulator